MAFLSVLDFMELVFTAMPSCATVHRHSSGFEPRIPATLVDGKQGIPREMLMGDAARTAKSQSATHCGIAFHAQLTKAL
jgi:hypothetical protein